MVVTPELLSAFPLFKPCPRDTLERLARQASLEKVARRAVIFQAGARSERVCFLFEGRLQGVDFTVDGREVGLYFVEPGDFCGELGLFDDGPQPEFVIGLTPSRVVFLPMEALREVMLTHAGLVKELGERMAARVRQLTWQRSLLGLPNVAQRVCCQLWNLVPQAERDQDRGAIRNPPTHMEIAIMLNLSRESVTRVFQNLQQQQLVRRDGGSRLLVQDLPRLCALAEGREEL